MKKFPQKIPNIPPKIQIDLKKNPKIQKNPQKISNIPRIFRNYQKILRIPYNALGM